MPFPLFHDSNSSLTRTSYEVTPSTHSLLKMRFEDSQQRMFCFIASTKTLAFGNTAARIL
ncbi:hypothetical protein HUJ05_003349 [Dendroctonus ponderosae]|nr:hypothetical protein HUJ05_003349 [Dendroctonus ponderosae]